MTSCPIFTNTMDMYKTFFDVDYLTSKKKLIGENESLLRGGRVTSKNLFDLFVDAFQNDRLGSVQKQNHNIILFS